MRFSRCTGKTLGRRGCRMRGRLAAACIRAGYRLLVLADAMVDAYGRTVGSAGVMIVLIAAAFVIFGVTRVLPEPVPVTVGARILLFPGAAALWPYVLTRWLKAPR